MTLDPIITREIAAIPKRPDTAHKGEAGRVVVIGGCAGEVTMVGAPALVANAAFRSGAGLVQMLVPAALQIGAATLAPCATARALPTRASKVRAAAEAFGPDVLAIGPGLGDSLAAEGLLDLLTHFPGPIVLDADGLNLLATTRPATFPNPRRIVMTPHVGEMKRLLEGRGQPAAFDNSPEQRRQAAIALVRTFGATVVLKGRGTVVTDGDRMYINETGNAGLATGGTGDVLTGVIAALLAQRLEPLEASILAVYLHGLAGDFAAESLGRLSMTATDVVDALPEAFGDQDLLVSE